MKRIALFAAASLVLAACSAKEEAPAADTAMAPAAMETPAPAMDSGAMMTPPDSMAMKMDTTKH